MIIAREEFLAIYLSKEPVWLCHQILLLTVFILDKDERIEKSHLNSNKRCMYLETCFGHCSGSSSAYSGIVRQWWLNVLCNQTFFQGISKFIKLFLYFWTFFSRLWAARGCWCASQFCFFFIVIPSWNVQPLLVFLFDIIICFWGALSFWHLYFFWSDPCLCHNLYNWLGRCLIILLGESLSLKLALIKFYMLLFCVARVILNPLNTFWND